MEVEKARAGSPWIKLYQNYRDAGLSVEEAKAETEKVLGPAPKGTVLKEEAGTESVASYVPVRKVDERLGLVMGYAIVSKIGGEDYYDLQGDHASDDEILRAGVDFMENSRLADEKHDYKDKGSVVFAFPLTAEVAKAFDIETPVNGLMIAMRPSDPEVLRKFQSGEYTGFSIGGGAIREEVAS